MPVSSLPRRDVLAALRGQYPNMAITVSAGQDGVLIIRMPIAAARYFCRDSAVAAAWLSCRIRTPAAITASSTRRAGRAGPLVAEITVAAADGPVPPDPGTSRGIPVYGSAEEVLAGFPANRAVRGLVKDAVNAGLRPHLDLAPSPRGRRYRVLLWGSALRPLTGCIDVSEASGRFAGAWLMWGRGPEETPYDARQLAAVRAEIRRAAS